MKKFRIPHNKREARRFVSGQTIFSKGQPGNTMYVVLKGEVNLHINGQPVEKLGPGGVLGEMALLGSAPRSATAVARTDCKLIPVNQKQFSLLVRHTPGFALQIMRIMAERLRRMDARM